MTTTIETSPFTPPTSSYNFPAVSANHAISATFGLNQYAITATAGANGAISPAGLVNVPHGADKTFDITADTGYHVASVTIDGVTTVVETSLKTPATYSYTFPDVAANHTIAAAFAINQYTFTASADTNGDIPPEGDTTVTYGDEQSYTIVANEGYHVHSVTVDGVTTVVETSPQAPCHLHLHVPRGGGRPHHQRRVRDQRLRGHRLGGTERVVFAGRSGQRRARRLGRLHGDRRHALSRRDDPGRRRPRDERRDIGLDPEAVRVFVHERHVRPEHRGHIRREPVFPQRPRGHRTRRPGDTAVGNVVVSPEQPLYAPDADVTLTAFAADG